MSSKPSKVTGFAQEDGDMAHSKCNGDRFVVGSDKRISAPLSKRNLQAKPFTKNRSLVIDLFTHYPICSKQRLLPSRMADTNKVLPLASFALTSAAWLTSVFAIDPSFSDSAMPSGVRPFLSRSFSFVFS